MSDASTLTGSRVLVVGASSGIGRQFALRAAATGARVAVAGRRLELLEEVAREAGASGAGAPLLAVQCDVTDEPQVQSLVDTVANAFGGLDIVVYASAIDPLIRIADVDAAAWTRLLATNVIGASLVTRAALPHLKTRPGRVLYISATSVGRPLPGMGAYAASKAALEELARAWRSEHRDIGFAVAAVGMTLGTGVADSWDPALIGELSAQWQAEGYLLDNGPGTMTTPDVADALLALVSAPVLMAYATVLPDPARSSDIG